MKKFKRKREKEVYAPFEEWVESPRRFAELPLNNGEYTVIVHARSGTGLYLLAKKDNIVRYCAYLDRAKFEQGFKKIAPQDIDAKIKEQEKFLI